MIVDELGRIPMSPFLKATLARAAEYAAAQSHREVTLEHLLLALAEDPEASVVLKLSNVDIPRLMSDVSAHLGALEDRVTTADMAAAGAISADLKRILEAAAAAAQQGRRREINGAIVLAAIVGDAKTPSAHMLRSQGLTFEEAIRALQRMAHAPSPEPSPAAGSGDPMAAARERVLARTGQVTAPPASEVTAPPVAQPQAQPAPAPHASGSVELRPAHDFNPQTGGAPVAPAPASYAPQPAPASALDDAVASLRNDRTGEPPRPAAAPDWQPARAPQPAQAPPPAGYMPPPSPPAPQPPMRTAPPQGYAPPPGSWTPTGAPAPVAAPPPPAGGGVRGPLPIGTPPPGYRPPGMESRGPGGAPFPMQDDALARLDARRPQAPSPQAGGRSMAGAPAARAGARGAGPGRPAVEPGQLHETLPRRMRVGIPVACEVLISRADVKNAAERLQNGGAAYRHEISITRAMTVRLRAPDGGFNIETTTPETQWIENILNLADGDSARWRWIVTARERGKKRLQLVVSARTVDADGLTAETALPDKVIEVKVSINYAETAKRVGGWVIAAVAGGLFARFGDGVFDLLRLVLNRSGG